MAAELQQLSAHFHSRSDHLVSLVYSDRIMSRDPVEGVAGMSTSTMETHVAPSMLFSCCMTANEDVTVANITVIQQRKSSSTRTRVRLELLQISICAHCFSNCATAAGLIQSEPE